MLGVLLVLLSAPGAATSPPEDGTIPIPVDAKTTPYVPLSSGSTLAFDTPGPRKLTVESRRRLAGAGQRAKHAPLEVRGDGNPIMTIKVPGTAIADGRIHDRLEGFPSKEDRTVITVPEGGRQLTLTAPPGGPDFFVRITDRDQPSVLIMPAGIAAAATAVVAKQEPQEAPRTGEKEAKAEEDREE